MNARLVSYGFFVCTGLAFASQFFMLGSTEEDLSKYDEKIKV